MGSKPKGAQMKTQLSKPARTKGQKGSATVLARKDKVRVFEEVVGEDDELSHEGGESEFFRFAASEETEVERSEDGVVARSDERGHVKDRADLGAAAEDVARRGKTGSHLNILTFESELDNGAGWLCLSGWNLRGRSIQRNLKTLVD
jgi:hypothetical protein